MPRLKLDPFSPSGVSAVVDIPLPRQSSPGYVVNKATGLITAGSNVTITGQGTQESPYKIASTGGGGTGGAVDSVNGQTGTVSLAVEDLRGYLDYSPDPHETTMFTLGGIDTDGTLQPGFVPFPGIITVNGLTGPDVNLSAISLDWTGTTLAITPDVDFSTKAPEDGDSLIYDGTDNVWHPVAPGAYTLGRVDHGSDASVGRPDGYYSIQWVGSVEPTNATNLDTWLDTT